MLNFGNAPDTRDAMRAAKMTDAQIEASFRLEALAYAEVRKVLERLGVYINRNDIWPTIENRMTKMKISVMHEYDPMTIGTPDDQGGWFIKKDDVLVARIPHPVIGPDGVASVHTLAKVG